MGYAVGRSQAYQATAAAGCQGVGNAMVVAIQKIFLSLPGELSRRELIRLCLLTRWRDGSKALAEYL